MSRRQLTVLDATASIVAVHTFGVTAEGTVNDGKHDKDCITAVSTGIAWESTMFVSDRGSRDCGQQSSALRPKRMGCNLFAMQQQRPLQDPPPDAFYNR
jgi:hypothetical protein